MGTRADFYVGFGEQAEWLGSIGWDGYPEGIAPKILRAKTENTFRKNVKSFIEESEGTFPEMGWPWPWEDSHLTDYAYAFNDRIVWATNSRGPWWDVKGLEPIHLKHDEEFRIGYHGEKEDEKRIVRVDPQIICPNCNHNTIPQIVFPNMASRKKVTLDSKRSGVMILGIK